MEGVTELGLEGSEALFVSSSSGQGAGSILGAFASSSRNHMTGRATLVPAHAARLLCTGPVRGPTLRDT